MKKIRTITALFLMFALVMGQITISSAEEAIQYSIKRLNVPEGYAVLRGYHLYAYGLSTGYINNDEFILIGNDNKRILLDKSGNLVDLPSYTPFSEGLALVWESVAEDERLYYIDKSGKRMFDLPIGASSANQQGFHNGLDWIHNSKMVDGIWVSTLDCIDKTGKIVFSIPNDDWNCFLSATPFSDGLALVYYEGDYVSVPLYYVDKSGSTVYTIREFYSEENLRGQGNQFSDGLAWIRKDNEEFFINTEGKKVLIAGKGYPATKGFSEGLAVMYDVKEDGSERTEWYIDKKGKTVITLPAGYSGSDFKNGIALVTGKEKSYFIDKTGATAYSFSEKAELAGYVDNLHILKDNSGYFLFINGPDSGANGSGSTGISTGSKPGAGNASAAESFSAVPTASQIIVNGKTVAFDAYTISGSNYFKLRDLSYVVTETSKQFEVGYDNATKAIVLTSGKPYTIMGGELTGGDGKTKSAVPTASKIYLDDKEVSLTAYTIGGSNYFKLRDIAKLFDFGVNYDNTSKQIGVDTDKGYVE